MSIATKDYPLLNWSPSVMLNRTYAAQSDQRLRCVKDQTFIDADSENWSDWEDAQADLSLRWVHMQYCWFYHVAAHFRSYFSQTPNIPLHIW